MSEPLAFLVRNIAGFFILNLLLRFYLQVARVSFAHPLAQFTVKLTNFAVLPLRRVIPSVGGYDSATLLLAFFTALLMNVLLLLLSPWTINLVSAVSVAGLIMLSLLSMMQFSLYLLFGAVLVQALLSWFSPYNPITPLLDGLTRPFLSPIRRILPAMSGIDLSPLVLILLLQMILMFALTPIENKLITYMVLGR